MTYAQSDAEGPPACDRDGSQLPSPESAVNICRWPQRPVS